MIYDTESTSIISYPFILLLYRKKGGSILNQRPKCSLCYERKKNLQWPKRAPFCLLNTRGWFNRVEIMLRKSPFFLFSFVGCLLLHKTGRFVRHEKETNNERERKGHTQPKKAFSLSLFRSSLCPQFFSSFLGVPFSQVLISVHIQSWPCKTCKMT